MRTFLFIILTWSCVACFELVADPLADEFRANEARMMAIRAQMEAEVERLRQERVEEAARLHEQVRAEALVPPWLRGVPEEQREAVIQSTLTGGASTATQSAKKNNRFLVSILLMILLAGAAGWARYATREVD